MGKYSKGEADFSVTELIDSTRLARLKVLYPYVKREKTAINSTLAGVRGDAVHSHFEAGLNLLSGYVCEQRLFLDVYGAKVSGCPDIIRKDVLYDIKTCNVFKVVKKKIAEWTNQLNLYAYMAKKSKDIEINQLFVIAVMDGWNQKQADANPEYPQTRFTQIPIPLWQEADQLDYLKHRIEEHRNVKLLEEEHLPICTDLERWKDPSTFAVLKVGGKRALRVFEDREAAEVELAKRIQSNKKQNYFIEERKDRGTRCKSYCRFKSLCEGEEWW